ncbi:reverse transcriptase [Tanacetum coccineum]
MATGRGMSEIVFPSPSPFPLSIPTLVPLPTEELLYIPIPVSNGDQGYPQGFGDFSPLSLLWHKEFMKTKGPIVTWEVYKEVVLARFGSLYDDQMSGLKNLKYDRSAKEYEDAFDNLLRHKWAGKMFSLILLPMEEDCFEDCLDEETKNRVLMGIEELQPQISLNALTGTNNFQTMRVVGIMGKDVMHILVDCGSTHNFLDNNMAKKLGCQIRPTGPLVVTLAYGNDLVTTYKCKDFKWQFDTTLFTTDVMLLHLGGCEMVLGIQWLATLRDIKCNFKELRIEFKYEGKKAEFYSMALSVYPMNEGTCFKLEGVPLTVDAKIHSVLDSYADVHPPTQKDTIGSMVKELLEAGVIKESHSPFASPIVMVKKKDSSWRMCVDYRQLNEQTIKDKFPIPIIEELIDELHGARLFTKLDLRMSTPAQLKWLPKLMGFDFEIVYKKRVDNVTVDALSRMQDPVELLRSLYLEPSTIKEKRTQSRMKSPADKGRTDKQFDCGDWVFLKLQPYRQCGTLPPCDNIGVFMVEPITLLDGRMARKSNGVEFYVLVRWANGSVEDAIWESVTELQTRFPSFNCAT